MKRKPLPLWMLDTLNAYQATGRVVSVFPFAGTISLNGFPRVSYEDAFHKMRETLYPDTLCKNNANPHCPKCQEAK